MSTLTTQELSEYMHSQFLMIPAATIGFLLSGALISFGISCIFLLSANPDLGTSRQHRLLRVYIIAQVSLIIIYSVIEFLWLYIVQIFDPDFGLFKSTLAEGGIVLEFLVDIVPVFVGILADGLLVWRCYMVQGALCNTKKWHTLLWVIPACLWLITGVTGCIGGVMILLPKWNTSMLPDTLLATTLSSNAALNIYATIFITAQLLIHRSAVIRCFGENAYTARYLHIVSILLESAAINIPIAITCAIGVGTGAPFGTAILPVAVGGQAFASVLIIHQVAIGRAFSAKQREEISNLFVESKETSEILVSNLTLSTNRDDA